MIQQYDFIAKKGIAFTSGNRKWRESPTTAHLFVLSEILDGDSPQHRRFREMFCSVTGIRIAE